MKKKSQKELDAQVKQANVEFYNSTLNLVNEIRLAFLKAFKPLTEHCDDQQAAYIQGQVDYFLRKILKDVNESLNYPVKIYAKYNEQELQIREADLKADEEELYDENEGEEA